ncbi:hypothetical protein KEM60_01367 [Austwickia sp. TVS 96-490-7B]|uniref:alpha/beta hydrolase n=1 Tax=Austwickia sp. TVS 96-490-7B TaxID=2830843 RepID=UPI001C59E89F|nr:alpha/beta fold hydrolase [Austwickia sp. TVS 96-490-7B]MBW3085170.1 hypothetical protein [Austwickia sp. TVS 96-490-7B]
MARRIRPLLVPLAAACLLVSSPYAVPAQAAATQSIAAAKPCLDTPVLAHTYPTWLDRPHRERLCALTLRISADLGRGDTHLAYAQLTPEAAAHTSEKDLTASFHSVIAQAGPLHDVSGLRVSMSGANPMVHATMRYARATWILTVTPNQQDRYNGIWTRPANAAEPIPLPPARTGPHAVDHPRRIGPYRLRATLATPLRQPARAVALIVPGSGPHDLDCTVGAAHNKPLRDIADGLAAQGIATLRVDKRFSTYPDSALPTHTIRDEILDDVNDALTQLQNDPQTRRLPTYVIGHSLGGMLLPTIMATHPQLTGGISLAGSLRSLWDIIADQITAVVEADPTLTPSQRAAKIAATRADAATANSLDDPTATTKLFGTQASYIVSLNRLHPAATAATINRPLLITQGGKDVQVSRKDFASWKDALARKPHVTYREFPQLNHLFMTSRGLGVGDYDHPGTVHPDVIRALSDFIHPSDS